MRRKNNYLISVFNKEGKNVDLSYSENLEDLLTIKVLFPQCFIEIADLRNMILLSDSEVEKEFETQQKKAFEKDSWAKRIRCVETGQVFRSLRECSIRKGIQYKTLYNAILNNASVNGIHFIVERSLSNETKRNRKN